MNDIKKENYHLTTGPQGPRYVIQSLRMHEQNEVASGLPPLYDPALMRESSSGDPLACRSGIAADVLRRVGVENAWHIAGGLALGSRPNGVSEDSSETDFMI